MGSLGLSLAALASVAACAAELAPDGGAAPAARYRDVVELFDVGIARTCSLNGGVCHNSNNYPDLHTVSNLVATVGRDCNVATRNPADVHDACEPAADRLVIPSAGLDARIVRVQLLPGELDAPVADLTRVTLTLDPPPLGVQPGATDTEVHRGATVFTVGEHGAAVASVDGAELVIDLRASFGDVSAKRFFDVRPYPPGPLQVHVGDPNGNGIEGAVDHAMPLIAAGDPERSYLLRRLIDDSYGELMPRQCRTWDDRANHALACWIAGLTRDDAGAITNAYAPIDYDACTIDVTGLGKCETIEETGYAAVEAIFTRSCAGTGCHVNEDQPAAGLDLSAGRAYASLVEVPAAGSSLLRVEPGAPDASYLWCKIADTCAEREGARMPIDADPLAGADLETIRAWITDGAGR